MTTFEPTSGIYVLEVQLGVIKVGLSGDTDRRIGTHLRNARSIGADPYRWQVVPCPAALLRDAERAAHAAVLKLGGQPQARTPEVFGSVYYNDVLSTVQMAVSEVVEYAAALDRLRALPVTELEHSLRHSPDDIAFVVRRLVSAVAS